MYMCVGSYSKCFINHKLYYTHELSCAIGTPFKNRRNYTAARHIQHTQHTHIYVYIYMNQNMYS